MAERAEPRPPEQRKADTLTALAVDEADVWTATAGQEGRPHLVPLSLCWTGERIVLVTEPTSATVRNLRAGSAARLGLGPTRDVVMIDATLESDVDSTEVEPAVADAFAAQGGWDPRQASGDFRYLILRPVRVQAWREENELAGRTLMRDGEWLV